MSNHIEQRTISALVQDKPGVLARIAGLFRRRGFNIASLTVGRSEQEGLSRMTFVVEGAQEAVLKVSAQLDKLVDIVDVKDITESNIVWRELALIKVNANSATRSKVLEIANIFRVNIVDIGVESLTMEISGGKQKIDSLIELLKQFGVKETLRTGRIATLRGTLIEGEEDGVFQSEKDNDNNFITPTYESGSV
ncbi:MAG: acetolactate synthase small subunit [Chloroflexi bacterium]|nr:acetolactate synthase small subunit [Chloroflexota bacterium]